MIPVAPPIFAAASRGSLRERSCEVGDGGVAVAAVAGRDAVRQVLEQGAASVERGAREGRGEVETQPCRDVGGDRRSEIAVEPGEIDRGIGERCVGSVDDSGQCRAVGPGEEVLCAEIVVAQDAFGGWRRCGAVEEAFDQAALPHIQCMGNTGVARGRFAEPDLRCVVLFGDEGAQLANGKTRRLASSSASCGLSRSGCREGRSRRETPASFVVTMTPFDASTAATVGTGIGATVATSSRRRASRSTCDGPVSLVPVATRATRSPSTSKAR